MKAICQAIILVLLATLIFAMLGSAAFIGFGAILSLWLPLSLFQASSLAIGATFVLAIVIFVIITMVRSLFPNTFEDDDLLWEPDDDENDTPVFPKPDIPKVGRNAPCPCGSGRKFKNCCGKSSVP